MQKERIKNGIDILQYAIDKKISAAKASQLNGYSSTYIKNIKSDINKKERQGKTENKGLLDEFKEKLKEYKKAFLISKDSLVESKTTYVNEREGTLTVNCDTKYIKSVDELLKYTSIDRKIWEVERAVVNTWDTTSFHGGVAHTKQNLQVKAHLKRKDYERRLEAAFETFEKYLKEYTPENFTIENVSSIIDEFEKENNLFELSIFDLHLGKLAWAGETGENYDVKIASERFIGAIKKLILRASAFSFNRILFPVGSDFFNSDNLFNTTTQGTPQDEDLRWKKTFDFGVKLILDAISLLKQSGVPIDIIIIQGNHDVERSYYLGTVLKYMFMNDDLVTVDNSGSTRKYYNYGKVLLGFTHGNEEKESSLPMLMATEKQSKRYWDKVKFREWHVGHIHRKRKVDYTLLEKNKTLNEDLGVTIRYLSSLTGTEEWHHRKGFVSQIKAADGFIWNHEEGLMAHLNTNITNI